MFFRLLAAVALAAVAGSLSACGAALASPDDGRVHVAASFYPLQFVVQRIGGDRVDVTSLTRPGAEPHDLELTPRDVAGMEDADLVVYLRGFQPAVDDAIAVAGRVTAFDTAPAARLDRTLGPVEGGEGQPRETGSPDPHFWLDPTRLSAVAAAVEQRLERLAPADASGFRERLATLQRDLATLDADFRTGLAHCASRDLVTSHTAFGYLGERYGLTQLGITGLSPDAEPGPRQLADVTRFVREHHVRTIYSETLLSPAVARTVADETGAATAVLDPIEGLSARSAGHDYLAVMRADLRTLRAGQGCS